MNAENTAAVIGLLASIAVDYAGGSAGTIGKECHEWMAFAATISILWSPVCVSTGQETEAQPKVRNGSEAEMQTENTTQWRLSLR